LDFHHVDSTKKEFGIGNSGYTRSWEKVKKELDKCILVCANCHREIHEGLIKIRAD
jgi:predicted HNH restriction endonuclease